VKKVSFWSSASQGASGSWCAANSALALAGKQRRSMHSQLLILIERGLRTEEREVARREAPQPR
jgi:hypothetical protein